MSPANTLKSSLGGTGPGPSSSSPKVTLANRRAQGVDISHWQNQIDPRRATVPLDFVIFKASEATSQDKSFNKHYQSTSAVPIRGAYHFIATGNVNAQVNAFLNSVQGKALDFFAVDLENNDVTGAKVSALTAQDAREFMRQVKQKTGKPVFLYTNESILTQYFNRPGDEKIPLWFAQPNKNALNPSVPGGRQWAIWQNAWDAPAGAFGLSRYDRGVDFNVFAGTPQEMKSYLQSLTTGGSYDLTTTAARSSGSLASSGAENIPASVPSAFSPAVYTSLFTPATATPPASAPVANTLKGNVKQSTGTTGARQPVTSSERTPAPATATATPPAAGSQTLKDFLKNQNSTPAVTGSAGGSGGGAPAEKKSPFEMFTGIDLASLGFILAGLLLIVVGLVIIFRRSDAPEGGS